MGNSRHSARIGAAWEGLPTFGLAKTAFGFEQLESRRLMTITATPQVEVAASSSVAIPGDAIPGFTPAQVKTAYSLSGITFNNGAVAADGSGQTIAIVDAYNDPNIASDLVTFDTTMGLPTANLTVVNQSGSTSNLPQNNATWSLETALDVEWAHAIAPGADILLVEADSDGLSDLMAAAQYAETVSGVSVVSMSWGVSEYSGETAYDASLSQTGVSFVAASGDTGSPGIWPAYSSNVLAVGATSLTLTADDQIASETAWSSGGGGTSLYETEPSFQNGVQSTGMRTTPDVSYDGDPSTGFAVYDSVLNNGSSGWQKVGGDSAGTPQWAAMIAIANQGRVLAGESPLSGAQSAIYALPSSDFNDITSGGNGVDSASVGYDEVTGLGTPIGDQVIAGLVGDSTVADAAPTLTGPSAVNVEHGGQLALNGSNLLTVADSDGGSSTETVSLSVDSGVLTVALDGGAVVSSGANDSSALTLSGTLTQLNAALATLTYTAPLTGSSDTFTAMANDGIASSSPLSLTITLADVPPTLSGPSAASVEHGALLTFSDANLITVADLDGDASDVETVSLAAGSGLVAVSLDGGASITNGASGTFSLTLSGTLTQLNAALATLTYTAPLVGSSDTLTIGASHGAALATPIIVSISLTDAPPTLSGPTSLVVPQSGVFALSGPNLLVLSDADADGAVETLALSVDVGSLAVTLAGGASISSGASDSAALTLSGKVDQINAALATLTYTAPSTGSSATLSATANDGTLASDTFSLPIQLTTSAVAVTLSGPGLEVVPLGGSLAFTASSLVQLANQAPNGVDTSGILETVSLAAQSGALAVSLTGGATIAAGANDSAALTISGTLTEINAALATLTYAAPTTGTSDTLTLTASYGTVSTVLTTAVTLTPSSPWQNSADPFDINNDGSVDPLDVAILISELQSNGSESLPTPSSPPTDFYDVFGTSSVSPIDVAGVIAFLQEFVTATPSVNSAASSQVAVAPANTTIIQTGVTVPASSPAATTVVDTLTPTTATAATAVTVDLTTAAPQAAAPTNEAAALQISPAPVIPPALIIPVVAPTDSLAISSTTPLPSSAVVTSTPATAVLVAPLVQSSVAAGGATAATVAAFDGSLTLNGGATVRPAVATAWTLEAAGAAPSPNSYEAAVDSAIADTSFDLSGF